MTRCSLITLPTSALPIPLVAVAVAACGRSSGSATTAATAPPTPANGQSAMVGVANTGRGKTLGDSPLRFTDELAAGTGMTRAELGAIALRKRQVSGNGHALYLFTGGQRPR